MLSDGGGDRGGKKKDCIVICLGCETAFAAKKDVDGEVHILGLANDQCCEGYEPQEVKDNVHDKFAHD